MSSVAIPWQLLPKLNSRSGDAAVCIKGTVCRACVGWITAWETTVHLPNSKSQMAPFSLDCALQTCIFELLLYNMVDGMCQDI